jgi:hypothetical protein
MNKELNFPSQLHSLVSDLFAHTEKKQIFRNRNTSISVNAILNSEDFADDYHYEMNASPNQRGPLSQMLSLALDEGMKVIITPETIYTLLAFKIQSLLRKCFDNSTFTNFDQTLISSWSFVDRDPSQIRSMEFKGDNALGQRVHIELGFYESDISMISKMLSSCVDDPEVKEKSEYSKEFQTLRHLVFIIENAYEAYQTNPGDVRVTSFLGNLYYSREDGIAQGLLREAFGEYLDWMVTRFFYLDNEPRMEMGEVYKYVYTIKAFRYAGYQIDEENKILLPCFIFATFG